MRLLLVLSLAAATWMELAARVSYKGYMVYRLFPGETTLELLSEFEGKPGFDFWTKARVAKKPMVVMVAPNEQSGFQSFLLHNLIDFDVLIQDVQVKIDEEREFQESAQKPMTGEILFNQYYQHPEINAYLSEVAKKHPNLASVEDIGKSTEGRDLKLIKISRGGNNPIIWIDAGIHAREWIAPAMALYIINQLLENPANSALLDGVDWHILPVVNPDGYQWSHTNNRMWRKTRSKTTAKDCPGVDGNRNYGFHWGGEGAAPIPCFETYRGPKAFSEPETAAIRDHLLSLGNKTALYLSFHSFGNYFLYPWGWTNKLPVNWKELEVLARKAVKAQSLAGGKPYIIGAVTNVLYEASGSSLDWAMGSANISLPYTIELPGGDGNGFDLPPSEIEHTVRELFEAIKVFGEHVRGPK